MSTDHTNITADILLSDAINNWLRSEYGLGDDDCLSSGDVAECVDMAVKHFLTKQKEEIDADHIADVGKMIEGLRMEMIAHDGVNRGCEDCAYNNAVDEFNQKLDNFEI